MDMELYKTLVDQCVQLGVSNLNIQGFGEPLLDPLLIDKLIYAKTRGIKCVTTNTNGVLLSPELSQSLVKAGLDRLLVSIDAATSETYQKVRPPGKLEVVEENVKNFTRLRDSMGKNKPLIQVKFVPVPENIPEIKDFKKKWKEADEIDIAFKSLSIRFKKGL